MSLACRVNSLLKVSWPDGLPPGLRSRCACRTSTPPRSVWLLVTFVTFTVPCRFLRAIEGTCALRDPLIAADDRPAAACSSPAPRSASSR